MSTKNIYNEKKFTAQYSKGNEKKNLTKNEMLLKAYFKSKDENCDDISPIKKKIMLMVPELDYEQQLAFNKF